MPQTEIVAIEDLPAYLELHGLRVVRGGWQWGDSRPYVILAAAPPAAVSDAQPVAEPERKEIDR